VRPDDVGRRGAGLGDLGRSAIATLGDMVDKYSKGLSDFSGF
jgi:hypothetical protein